MYAILDSKYNNFFYLIYIYLMPPHLLLTTHVFFSFLSADHRNLFCQQPYYRYQVTDG